jgi:uncharacterized membrane protein
MSVAEQVQYESAVRFRYAVIAFVAALLTVASQLLLVSGVHAPVNELTLDLIAQSQRTTLDIVGGALDMAALLGIAVLLYWLHRISSARRPEFKAIVRYVAVVGAVLAAVMAISYTIVIAHKSHEFVTTGTQGYLGLRRRPAAAAGVRHAAARDRLHLDLAERDARRADHTPCRLRRDHRGRALPVPDPGSGSHCPGLLARRHRGHALAPLAQW